MTDLQLADEIIDRLGHRNPRYRPQAYVFVLAALHTVVASLDEPRHVSGRELADGVRRLALERFGLMARAVLGHWGIHTTEDLGGIVFELVDCGILIKQEGDSEDDFRDVFDFEEAFDRDYPWEARL
jgi:uncharacterized repeat protein (TIGR04138 family)